MCDFILIAFLLIIIFIGSPTLFFILLAIFIVAIIISIIVNPPPTPEEKNKKLAEDVAAIIRRVEEKEGRALPRRQATHDEETGYADESNGYADESNGDSDESNGDSDDTSSSLYKSASPKLTKEQFDRICDVVREGKALCSQLNRRKTFYEEFCKIPVNSEGETCERDSVINNLHTFLMKDFFEIFEKLGHPITELVELGENPSIDCTSTEGQALEVTAHSIMDEERCEYDIFREEMLLPLTRKGTLARELRNTVAKGIKLCHEVETSIKSPELDEGNLITTMTYFNQMDLLVPMRKVLYEFAAAVAESDGTITLTEKRYLDELKRRWDEEVQDEATRAEEKAQKKAARTRKKKTTEQPGEDNGDATTVSGNPQEQLDELIGLTEVKQELHTLRQFISVSQKREAQGLKVAPISYHCVFVGNPGTGKTTVARILAGIYHELGVLEGGQLVETDRSGLVAEYVGQTAVKTNKIIDKALGGVLFIDEAYTLVQGSENDFGREAIATLLKRMEDDRDRLVVVLAGYNDEMEQFIQSNPGLRSRFNRYIHFSDYSAEELYQIFLLQLKKYDYTLEPEAETRLRQLLEETWQQRAKDFGNARFVRNFFEKVIERQARRLTRKKDVEMADLQKITADDLTKAHARA